MVKVSGSTSYTLKVGFPEVGVIAEVMYVIEFIYIFEYLVGVIRIRDLKLVMMRMAKELSRNDSFIPLDNLVIILRIIPQSV